MEIMVLQPNPRDYPRIRSSLKWYKIASIVTGVMLLLLLTEMILKYSPTHVELFAGGDGGLLSFAPVVVGEGCQWYSLFNPFQEGCEMTSTGSGTNLSLMILIIHGWFYVAYLIACFMVWSPMRWRFSRFLKLALGGVIPLLSFFMEVKVVREVTAYLNEHEGSEQAQRPREPQTLEPQQSQNSVHTSSEGRE
jgi:integral membrane protein